MTITWMEVSSLFGEDIYSFSLDGKREITEGAPHVPLYVP